MSGDTTVEWLMEKKASLEWQILKDIQAFELVTGMNVSDVRLTSLDHTCMNDATRRVVTERVEVEARL